MKVTYFKAIKKPFKYWYPGTNVASEIARVYGNLVRPGDLIAISEKALCVSKGLLYDEGVIHPDPFTKFAAYIVNRVIWGKFLRELFNERTRHFLLKTPLNYIASHKKLSLKLGGLKHFIKPLSEAGIDATNLPYTYVSLPIRNADKEAKILRDDLVKLLKTSLGVLIVDSDRTFKLRNFANLAIATRPSSVRGVIDLGGIAYFIGRTLNELFVEYPTPVAYAGKWIGLTNILKVARLADKLMGYGLGRNVLEMVSNLGRESFSEVLWSDMSRVRHYPAVLIRPICL
ncbi:MAG: coenzyme F420-0:L-glutamate ligase [Sulfolobales archaeon]|nr:coenzyme F420-0:L-glutamate ligase [Sulfolobales archaeon]MCX8198452.1 coenzyme F420-0:L-glutamate ligase [Sulfolobales archaeon]MDW8169526.1 coenzyme F420-0:L-glutamate ligase [Desulfurococcaceae archaeon]